MMSNPERSIRVLPLSNLHLHFVPPPGAAACAVCRIEHGVLWRDCERCGVAFHESCYPGGAGSVTEAEGRKVAVAIACPGCCS